jgi:hypothetical protein
VQLYGLNAPGHHFTNVLLHAAAAVLLFLALCRLTTSAVTGIGDAGRDQRSRLQLYASAFVAAIFAVHPLRVESVAWVAERKDVLSGVFFGLTLLTYASYARRQQFSRYVAVVTFFALGLMCKPTLVTVPFVLLLLDYWPLRRMQIAKGEVRSLETGLPAVALAKAARLVVEKIPLFVLSAASCWVTLLAEKTALANMNDMPVGERAANAVESYVAYLGQLIYPARLTVWYPYSHGSFQFVPLILAVLVLLAISAISIAGRRRHPYLIVGWLWYLVMLLPMIGIVQVGQQPHADRYTYLPLIGVSIALTWSGIEFLTATRFHRSVVAAAAVVIVAALVTRCYGQTAVWQNTEVLWKHAIEVTSNNYMAYYNLANVLRKQGRLDEAIAQYQNAIRINPAYPQTHYNLSYTLAAQSRFEDAISECRAALRARPDFIQAYNGLGAYLDAVGRPEEAVEQFEQALRIDPKYSEAHLNLARVLIQFGRREEAEAHWALGMRLQQDAAATTNNSRTP